MRFTLASMVFSPYLLKYAATGISESTKQLVMGGLEVGPDPEGPGFQHFFISHGWAPAKIESVVDFSGQKPNLRAFF